MRDRSEPRGRRVTVDDVLDELRAAADPSRLPGMARVGIRTDRALGVSMPNVRRIAKRAGRDQRLAEDLWSTGGHEARLVAGLVADPARLSFRTMTAWARALDSWDTTDLVAETFIATPHAERAIETWSRARHGFTSRCAFSMIARLAVTRKEQPDEDFLVYLPMIRTAAADRRPEVTKAVSWALRQIGKRSHALRTAAIAEAKELRSTGDRPARRVGADALRELTSPATVARITR